MTGAVCPRCLTPSVDGVLCQSCVAVFERAVADLGVLLPELATTAARHDRVHRANVHRHTGDQDDAAPLVVPDGVPGFALAPHALPINPDAVDLERAARRTLLQTVAALRFVDAARRAVAGPVCARGLACGHESCWAVRAGYSDVTGWLLAAVPTLRTLGPAAGGLVDDLAVLARRVETMVDRRAADVYAGPCDAPDLTAALDPATGRISLERAICGVDLYTRLGAVVVECPACGAVYDVKHRRAWMLDAARDVCAYPALIVQALSAMDVDLTLDRLYKWISRDRFDQENGSLRQRAYPPILAAVDETGGVLLDGEGRRMYRVGDVLARVEVLRAEKRRAEKEATG